MKTKRLLVSLLTMLAAICMAFSVVMLSTTVKANSFTEEPISTGTFTVLDGASARTQKGTSGIRYIVQMSPDFYNSVASKDGVKFGGILALDTANTAGITLDAVDGTTIKDVAWAAPSGNQWGTTPTTINPTAIDVEEDGTVDYYQYNLVVSFGTDGRTEADLAILYATNYNVRAYVSYTEGGAGKVIYSNADANTNRNLTAVAETVLLEDALNANVYAQDEMVEAKSILVGYAGALDQLFPIENLGYIEDFSASATKTFTGISGVPNGNYKASINGSEYVEVTITDGSFSIPALPEGLVFGNKYVGVIKSDDGLAFAQQFMYVSKAIDNADELSEMLTYYKVSWDEGGWYNFLDIKLGGTHEKENPTERYYNGATFTQRYYVLADNIDFTNNPISTKDPSSIGRIYADILDGQGYKITASVKNMGLFGNMAIKSVIKNTSFDLINTGASEHSQGGHTLGLAYYVGGSVLLENLYVNFRLDTAREVTGNVGPLYRSDQWTAYDGGRHNCDMNNVVVNIDDNVAPTDGNATSGWLTAMDYFDDANFNNVYGVSKNLRYIRPKVVAHNQTLESGEECFQYARGNIFKYDSIAELRVAAPQVGNWVINEDGTATWKDSAIDTALQNYVSKNSAAEKYYTPIILDDVAYIEEFNQTDDCMFNGFGVEDGTYEIYINGVLYGEQWVEGGEFYFEDIEDGVFGDQYQVYFLNLDGGDNYVQTAKYVSAKISTAFDLVNALTYYTAKVDTTDQLSSYTGLAEGQEDKYYDGANFTPRYYVLTNDVLVDTTWNASADSDYMKLCENIYRMFADVFDGQGHTITDPCFYGPGLFGKIGSSAVIKDLKLDIVNANNANYAAPSEPDAKPYQGRTIIGSKVLEGAVLENLYLNFASDKTEAYNGWQGVVFTGTNFTMRNITVVYADSIINTAAANNQVFGFLAGEIDVDNVVIENCVSISKNISVAIDDNTDQKYVASNQTVEGYTSIEGSYYYENIISAINDGINSVGSWTIDGTWVGEDMVYTVSIGDVIELGDTTGITITAQGTSAEVVGNYAIAREVGLTVLMAEGASNKLLINVIDANDNFTATADTEIAIDGTTSIEIADQAGKVYVGNVVYATDVDGIISIANDGTITGLAEGTVNVKVAINIGGTIRTLTVAITVA